MTQYKGAYYYRINGKRECLGTDLHAALLLLAFIRGIS